MRIFVDKLETLRVKRNMMIVFTAHTHIKNFSNPLGENYDRYELKASKGIGGYVKEWVDAHLFAHFEIFTKNKDGSKAKGIGGDKRVVHTVKSATWDAKNRYSLPNELPFDMPDILEKIKDQKPADPKEIIKEIKDLYKGLTEGEKKKADDYMKVNKKDAIKLSGLLNKVRVKSSDGDN